MCEFCNNPFSTATNKDAQHIEFAGFFSSAAIDAAIRQAQAATSTTAATTNTVEADSDEDTSDSEDDQSESEESNDT
jgi:NaMN:DMB phosphoribosyltransferase